MGINRIVTTRLQTTHMNFSKVVCIMESDSVVCNFFSWLYWSQFFLKCRGAYTVYNNCECWAVRSHAGNISVNELCPCQFYLLYSPQEGANAPTAQTDMQVLRTVFLGRLSSWPASSTNLALPDYFLWGYVKQEIYKTHPANNDDLK